MTRYKNLTDEQFKLAVVDMLIEIRADQRALSKMLMHLFSNGDLEKETYHITLLNDIKQSEADFGMEDVFLKYGSFSVDDALEDDETK